MAYLDTRWHQVMTQTQRVYAVGELCTLQCSTVACAVCSGLYLVTHDSDQMAKRLRLRVGTTAGDTLSVLLDSHLKWPQ